MSAIINIKFAADLKQFSSQMQNASRSIKKVSKKLQNVGAVLSVSVTAPFAAFAASSVKNWDTQAKAIAQVEAGLRSTGNAVGYNSEKLQQMASELQNNTLFGDEEILKGVTSQLLTFTNIAGEQFKRTQQAALDLATRLDGDLKGASIQLGKALNDPIANLSVLSRSGIQFSEEQKSTIKTMVETNRLAEAQTVILNELEKQYGGSAAAAAKAGTGPLKQLANSFGDLKEEFGKIILEAIIPFVDKLKGMVAGFQSLSPETKKFIVILGGVAAAVGPLLALAGTILPAIMSGFTLLTGPIGLVVAGLTAVGVVIYKNWSPIKKTLVDIANYFIDLYNESTVFRIAVESVVLQFKNMWSVAKFVFRVIKDYLKGVAEDIVRKFKVVGGVFKAALTGNFSDIPNIIKGYNEETRKGMSKMASDIKADWSTLMVDVSANTKKALEAISGRTKIKLLKENVDVKGVEEKVQEISPVNIPVKLGGVKGRKKVESVAGGLTPSGVSDVSSQQEGGLSDENIETTIAGVDSLEERLTSFQESSQEIASSVAGVFEGMGNDMLASFGLADRGFQGFIKSLAGTIIKLISMLLASSLANAISGATTSGTATGPAAVVTTPTFIATAVAGVLAAFAAIPKFETGGIFGGSSYFGDKILARVNSGELVLNQRQQERLYNMITPAQQSLQVVLGGELTADAGKLRMVLDRYDSRKSRTT